MPKNHRVAKIVIGTCKTCRNEFILTPAQKWQLKMKPNKNTFCSADCYSEFKKGSGNPKWRGGRTTTDGYVYIYMPNHPYAVKKGYVCEHRLIMEKHIGRYLKPEESIHHIDENTLNNNINNLKLFATEGEHRAFHCKNWHWVNGKRIRREDVAICQ